MPKYESVQKKVQRRLRKLARLERIPIQSEYQGELIYISKKHYDQILKKVMVTSSKPVGGSGGKVIIQYRSKNGVANGVLELYDIGPKNQ